MVGGVGVVRNREFLVVEEVVGDVCVAIDFADDGDDHGMFPIQGLLPNLPPCDSNPLDDIWENFSIGKDEFGLRYNQRMGKLSWL